MLGIFYALLTATMGCKPHLNVAQKESLVMKTHQASRKLGINRLDFRHNKGLEADFLPFVKDYETLAQRDIGEVAIRFGRVNTFGSCNATWHGSREIVINRQKWDAFDVFKDSYRRRRIMLFHELGHCVQGKDHTTDRIYRSADLGKGEITEISYPKSIMAPYLSQEDLTIILRNEEAYIGELLGLGSVEELAGRSFLMQ